MESQLPTAESSPQQAQYLNQINCEEDVSHFHIHIHRLRGDSFSLET